MALSDLKNELPPGPFRKALEFANKAAFTQEELDAHAKAAEEVPPARDPAHAAGWAEGEAAGQVRAILVLLGARGVFVSTAARAQFEACKDAATLDRWIVRAATASSAEEVSAPPSER